MDRELQMPYAPVAQASALLGTNAITGGLGPSSVTAACSIPYADPESASTRHTTWCLGGLNQDPDAGTTLFYNPATTTLAAPPMPDLPMPPKTQYAPQGPVLMEALVLRRQPPGVCVCPYVCLGELVSGSVGALLMTARNMIRVRRGLQKAGVVVAAPELAALTDKDLPCLCAGLGADGDLFKALFAFATQYGNTPAIVQPNPAELVAFLNTVFVKQCLDNIYHAVTSDAIANYARAEGNRAYLQPRPISEIITCDPVESVAQRGHAFCERELQNPTSTALRRMQLGELMGIPNL